MNFRLRHIGVVSQDIDSARDFWEKAFGFKVFWDQVEPSPYISELLGFSCPGLRTVKMSNSTGFVIELLRFPETEVTAASSAGHRLCLSGVSHFAIDVHNIENAIAQLISIGAEVVSTDVQIPPDSPVKVAYLRAPDNVYLELVEAGLLQSDG